jgi:hypothetical protein
LLKKYLIHKSSTKYHLNSSIDLAQLNDPSASLRWPCDTQHNDAQLKDIRDNDTQLNDTHHNDTQLNDTTLKHSA